MLNPIQKQHGVTLVELMIASSIGLIAIAAILTVYTATAQHASHQLRSAHLKQQLHAMLHLMANDIQRAGYWHFDATTQPPADNPFNSGDNRLRTGTYLEELSDSCLLFAYDLDRDGHVGIGQCRNQICLQDTDNDNVEQFGFRLREISIQSRYAGDSVGCESGYWQTLNDADIEVLLLQFRLLEHCSNLLSPEEPCADRSAGITQRAVSITLSGQLINQADSRIDLERWVVLRNDILEASMQ